MLLSSDAGRAEWATHFQDYYTSDNLSRSSSFPTIEYKYRVTLRREKVEITWSGDHVEKANQGSELLLKLDSSSGSGFKSRDKYLFGHISMDIKLVAGESAGTVTSFYLESESKTDYYEYDFEFLGNVSGEPYIVQTNVYTAGQGSREQRIYLWFDPTDNFHTYSFLWTKQHTIFLVDSVPVRIFKNNQIHGLPYPSTQPMSMKSSIWNGEDWATQGGRVKTDWARAPFIAGFRNFSPIACVYDGSARCSADQVTSTWSEQKLLNATEELKLEWVRTNFMVYDYCLDVKRYPSPPAECML